VDSTAREAAEAVRYLQRQALAAQPSSGSGAADIAGAAAPRRLDAPAPAAAPFFASARCLGSTEFDLTAMRSRRVRDIPFELKSAIQ